MIFSSKRSFETKKSERIKSKTGLFHTSSEFTPHLTEEGQDVLPGIPLATFHRIP